MGGRSGKQCRERWYNHLSPAVTKAEWSVEEDEAIHRKVLELGTRHRMHTGVAPPQLALPECQLALPGAGHQG